MNENFTGISHREEHPCSAHALRADMKDPSGMEGLPEESVVTALRWYCTTNPRIAHVMAQNLLKLFE